MKPGTWSSEPTTLSHGYIVDPGGVAAGQQVGIEPPDDVVG
jgi:hypothetical protein